MAEGIRRRGRAVQPPRDLSRGNGGEAWGKPLAKTREYVEIVRRVLRRELLER